VRFDNDVPARLAKVRHRGMAFSRGRTVDIDQSLEPGLSVSLGKNYLVLDGARAVKSHGSRNIADVRTNSPLMGIVSLADSQITLSYSRRF